MLFEDFLVDTGLVVEAFEEGLRRQAHEVADALAVAGQEGEVEGIFVTRSAAGGTLEPAVGGDVGFQADDRLDAGGFGLSEEFDGPVEVAVVGDRQRGHAEVLDPLDQLGNLAGAVEQAVVGVAVQVNEGPLAHA